MRIRKALLGLVAVVLCTVVYLFFGAGRTEATDNTSTVVIMRCLAFPEPSFRYQVTTLAHTPNLDLDIAASTIDGEGENCAVAIAQILASDVDSKKMTLHASENALVMTLVD